MNHPMLPLLVSAVFTAIPVYGMAAQFPKSGEAEFATYATVRTLASFDSGAGTGGVWDYSGVMQTANGDGPFNNMTVRCLQNSTNISEQFHIDGSCILTDLD